MDFQVFSPYNPIVKQTLRRRKEIPKRRNFHLQRPKTYEQEHAEDLERIRNFCLMDDEFMSAVFSEHPEALEELLRITLSMPTLQLQHVHTQEALQNLFGRSVVLDAYCIDINNRHYDIEIQRSDEGAVPKRARYNACMLDTHSVQKGLHPKDFPECFVIFFTESDIFHEFKPIYHVERSIVETGLPFNDEQHIIYVNGQNKEDTPLGQLVHDLWQADPANIKNPKLRNAVAHYKTTKEGQQRMCRSLEKMRNETLEIAATEMIERLLSKGKTPDEIIDLCEYPKELVYEVAESLLEKA